MSHYLQNGGAPHIAVHSNDLDLRSLREQFLESPQQTDLSTLRPVIARSWRRSVICEVNPNLKILDSTHKAQIDEHFLQAASPILADLIDLCRRSHGCIGLSDSIGTIAQFRGESSMMRWIDNLFPTSGVCMSEEMVGTNSDGTAVEEGVSVQVWGGEHFNGAFQDTCCTSVPIRDPLKQSIRGVLTMTLPLRSMGNIDPRTIMLILQSAAIQIANELYSRLAHREQALLAEYLREVSLKGSDAIIAIDGKTTIASKSATKLLTQSDYAVLAAYANEASHTGRIGEYIVWCNSNLSLKLQVRPVGAEPGDKAGAVIRISRAHQTASTNRISVPYNTPTPEPISGLAGKSILLRRVIELANTAARQRMSAYIIGESGTGKRKLAITLAQKIGHNILILDCTDRDNNLGVKLDEWSKQKHQGSVLVLQQAENLSSHASSLVRDALIENTASRIILTAKEITEEILRIITPLQGVEIKMPPLRMRRDDIPTLIESFLSNMQSLKRPTQRLVEFLSSADWPGNIRQLKEVIEAAALRSQTDDIKTDDLTQIHHQSLARSKLSRLEKAELNLIQEALIEAKGNRVKAASLLRIGRSTLYRKIETFASRGFKIGD